MLTRGDKILFVSQYAGFIGGLERYIHAVASLLKREGFAVYCIYAERVNAADEFLSVFDKHWTVAQLDAVDETFALATLHKIVDPALLDRLIEKFAPTVFVHDHDYYCPKGYKYLLYKRKNCTFPYGPWCGLCASLVPPRQVKDGYAALLKRNFVDAPRRFAAFKKAPAYVVLSEFMKRNLVSNGVSAERVRVLHPFLDVPAHTAQPESGAPPTLVFIGQQVMSKGTPLFLEAVRAMQEKARAFVVGNGPRLEDFRALSRQMGLEGRVEFTGWISNPRDYLMRADVAVFPSLWQEPFGLSGIEAMSCAVPVVAFNVGGVSEWLRDGYNGLLVPERDTAAMAAALDALVRNPDQRKKLGEQGRAFVRSAYAPQKFLTDFATLA